MVIYSFLGPYDYCLALSQLRGLAGANPPPIIIDQVDHWQRHHERLERGGKFSQDVRELLHIQHLLGTGAFCRDYPLTITAILTTLGQPNGMDLTIDEQLYLLERARFHGLIDEAHYLQAMDQARPHASRAPPYRDLPAPGVRSPIAFAPLVSGYWQNYCRKFDS